jgi:hypothetical protein
MVNAIADRLDTMMDRIRVQLATAFSRHIIKPRIKKKWSAPKDHWTTEE